MPQRIVRDWTDSIPIDLLTPDEEVLFIRLIMKADDFGCFHGNAKMIKSLCFPLKDSMRLSDISRWIENLQTAGLIRKYQDKGREYLMIVNFGQRLRQRKRSFPEPPGTCQQPAVNLLSSGQPEVEVEEKKKMNPFFEMFRRAAGPHITDEELQQQAGKFKNKYPNIHPNQSGALINAWVANIGKQPPKEKRMIL